MTEQPLLPVTAPSLPKGGGAIQSIGKGWAAIGAHGTASYEIALPISPGRGFAPPLSLSYASSLGNGVFGIGWELSLPCVARRTGKGVPAYTEDDEIIGPSGVVWLPERDAQGVIATTRIDHYNDLHLGTTYTVTRYLPRIESRFDRIEHWSSPDDKPGFWLVHGADGSLHLFGKNPASRRADSLDTRRVGEWLLEESLNPYGEHILYQYKADATAQRYLSRVSYGNFKADPHLYSWKTDRLAPVQWHFELVFDYGERTTAYEQKPPYEGQQWATRSDGFASFAYGFELRTERLCRQVLMFHRFPEELGAAPILVRRLLLAYRQTSLGLHQLSAAHDQAFGDGTTVDGRPPVEFSYSEFKPRLQARAWQRFDDLPGLNDGHRYQLVDLYGEGLPGVLYQSDAGWLYREPVRAKAKSDKVAYAPWRELPHIPVADHGKPMRQSLNDLTGDGRLDWLVAQPGLSGFFSLGADRSWADFATFNAFPTEFFSPQGQLADLTGEGLGDLVLIGPRSVRLYVNQREHGFAAPLEVARDEHEDALAVFNASPGELVAFSDVLGSGQQHLVRIRHNEVTCWPNLGHGRFGKGIVLDFPGLAYETFDASRIRLADLDGSGAVDLIYLQANQALIFMNRCGQGFRPAVALPWPPGLRYDNLCQVSIADLRGLGCSSLILSVPHITPQHWRYDFVESKPYLLTGTHNNMGASETISYRSSAQEWLDEKAAHTKAGTPAVCHVPMALHLVSSQTREDEITGNRLTRKFAYRQGYYDGVEREFRGFGLLLETDNETNPDDADAQGFTMPSLKKTWFHTGKTVDMPRIGYNDDPQAVALGKALLCQYQGEAGHDIPVAAPTPATRIEMARALSGHVLRSETFGVDRRRKTRTLYSVQEHRYRIRLLQAPDSHRSYARMLPLPLESITYQYEGTVDDPQCQHTLNLQHDQYGALTHSLDIHYARRKTADDNPPFSDVDQQRWWRDAHDPAQQFYYLNETRAEFIHLQAPQAWRLGLPYRQRTQALRCPKAPEAGGLAPQDMTFETFSERVKQITWTNQSTLTGLTVQRYKDALSPATLADGVADFQALTDHLETAELDENALKAFRLLPQETRPKGRMLERNHYHRMADFLPASSRPVRLWSVKSGFATYAPWDGFYKIRTLQPSESHGVIEISHDNRHCVLTRFQLPDGCATEATYDYRSLQPRRVTDPNGNVQEGLLDAFGQVLATSFYGNEHHGPRGFKPLAQFKPPPFSSPIAAISQSRDALQDAATALYYAPFSWMGCVSTAALADTDWLARCVNNGDLLPGGHICASARNRLAELQALSADDLKLKNELKAALREPVHIATLVADRYPDDDRKQIRIAVTCFDGFGRTLQSKQLVEPGMAYVVDARGDLTLTDGTPKEQIAARRWRVSERVEYNSKGLAVRIYRPYFADQHRCINDESLRQFGHYDRQFYDALGRPTLTRLVRQAGVSYMRRHTRHPWYTVDEDENDTLQEVMSEHAATVGGEA
ncbi:Insecticide toxin TcdB middle/C-terminal region [Pseudomonas sp. 43mfcvi1.1]|uniref:SpvB/TcaC N-terminal domain-containing protein n=1 Tax=Pseudomonas sp. 43mfcvi1.1 TaxID=1761894 RepID=UPI000D6B0CC2|nr:SpvB/TcaC N-terminal domain-containing protein [Pseudomonas sp. 43mfcvi1.1]PWJ38051.1 insecticide toxin TcdB-like protein [Pseudomonas sp. 43mfcvi1.1]SSB96387.1 Insecticide toxin TcdB middle/C-terminal region [Pseudomonas sp. 43mfcvi1.1]